ncbi:gamma-tubulin complex component 5 isoform X1 [Hylaeus volcanicus]|uniref:gamma-tubulin complex component 5 isoform X1 n=1 Tax=Hylaeus volcanicus TaxID=313075 RepID=UPI0023B85117|nr:gamma-tubulin complex component 5 isoform X1 [Hylaeus volcanicus]
MGTKTLNDIHTDIKQLITTMTSFEENEEGFRVCERFCTMSIKHHRYLSVNSNTTKEAINDLITKFSIHGKYNVAKKFEELVDTFLSSFDFEQHPQYDLQWYLLTFLLELSKETCKSDLECLKLTRGENIFNATGENENEVIEEIDWAQYLKEDQQHFFHDYKSDTESEWSDDTEDSSNLSTNFQTLTTDTNTAKALCIPTAKAELSKLSVALNEELKSRNWLMLNIQNTWWNELERWEYPVKSKFCDAYLCEIWRKATETGFYSLGTLSEYLTCRELLWMFYTQARMVVFQQNEGADFSIRPDISIPSLTIVAFNGILQPFCKYFSMIYDIEQFGIDLYSERDGFSKKPPLTYEAYNAALEQHLINFKNKIIDIEKNLMKQDDCFTLLSLSTLLKKHLCSVKILHDVHKGVISNWRDDSNWMCASKLLSSLYFEMQKSHNRKRTNICASLYLSSLAVYLNIIDTWLSEGRFEDWREEFIIYKFSNDVVSQNNEQYEVFSLRSLDDICLADPIMQFLIKKVQHMGQSIELLVSLDRITDIWQINSGSSELRSSLMDEFYAKLEIELSKYGTGELQEELPIFQENEIIDDKNDEDVEKNIVQELSEFNNPFLLKALEGYIPPQLLGKDISDACCSVVKSTKVNSNNLFKRLEKVSNYILPYRKILENILADILVSRYNNASKLVKNIMSEEYKLESHLTLMRSVYMMEAGHIMSTFYQKLFHEIETNQMWCNPYFLSCILEEVLSPCWPDSSSRWSVTVCSTNTNQVLVAVDNITLHYAIGWPINIILNEKTFVKYNEIFRFQLRLKWALWTLNNLRFSDLEGSKSMRKRNKLEQFHIRRIESLRFSLLHAISSIHTYLSGQVLQNLSLVLEKSLMQADSLDVIISVHNEYLRKVHEHCLLTAEYDDLMVTVNNLIEMCSHIRARWNHKNLMFASEELDVLESSYAKYHTYLAMTLHNAIQNKDANYCKSEILLTALYNIFQSDTPKLSRILRNYENNKL